MTRSVASTATTVNSVGSVGSLDARFPRFRELPARRPIAPALPEALLPEPLRRWLVDIAERMQVPLEMPAATAIVGLSSMVGRRVGIHPKAEDDWLVVPNTWGGLIAPPGWMKSPVLAETLKPIRRLERASRERHREKVADLAPTLDALNTKDKATKNLLRKAYEGKTDVASPSVLEEQLREIARECREIQDELTERRYVVNDATVEKLGELLAVHPQGLLQERDELAGWLRNLEREDRKGDREFFLEAWNGLNPYTYDRIGRGTIHIPALCLSILGGIQPTKLERFVSDALSCGYAADGLLQRFQLLVWPEATGEWELVDRQPDEAALNAVSEIYEAIDQLRFQIPRGTGLLDVLEPEENEVPAFRFSERAQQLFYDWLSELEARLRSPELSETPAFTSHLAKYRSLMPSLALLFHLVDMVATESSGPVSLGAAKLAADWCEFLEEHARKVYADELEIGLSGAHELARRIRKGEVKDGMTVRDIYVKGWSGLASAEPTWDAVDVLADHGWLRVQTVRRSGAGRPSHKVRLNPRLMEESS